jgi:hypothetical protein
MTLMHESDGALLPPLGGLRLTLAIVYQRQGRLLDWHTAGSNLHQMEEGRTSSPRCDARGSIQRRYEAASFVRRDLVRAVL